MELKITIKGEELKKVKHWQKVFGYKKPQSAIRKMIEIAKL